MSAKRNKIIVRGYTPFPYQSAVHEGLNIHHFNSIHIVKSRRQCGKSLLLCNQLLKESLNFPNKKSYSVSPTLSQSRKLYEDIKGAIGDSLIVRKTNDSRLEITFVNNSIIYFKSAEQRENLRGITVTGILCIDEAAFILDDIFYTLLPTVDVHAAPILITSTPKFKQGFFYDFWIKALQKEKNIYCYDVNDYDTSMLLSNEKLEQYRALLPKNQFQTEYLGEFLDGDSLLFGDFKQCIELKNETNEDLFVGIDWGTGAGQDNTAISIMSRSGVQVYCKQFNDEIGRAHV